MKHSVAPTRRRPVPALSWLHVALVTELILVSCHIAHKTHLSAPGLRGGLSALFVCVRVFLYPLPLISDVVWTVTFVLARVTPSGSVVLGLVAVVSAGSQLTTKLLARNATQRPASGAPCRRNIVDQT